MSRDDLANQPDAVFCFTVKHNMAPNARSCFGECSNCLTIITPACFVTVFCNVALCVSLSMNVIKSVFFSRFKSRCPSHQVCSQVLRCGRVKYIFKGERFLLYVYIAASERQFPATGREVQVLRGDIYE